MLLDPEGVDLPDVAAVAKAALAAARSILSAEVLDGQLPLDMHLDVEDEGGSVVHRLSFCDAVVLGSRRARRFGAP